MSAKAPTEKQAAGLRILASGAAGLSWGKRQTEPLLRRGWVTAKAPDGKRQHYYQWVRITADGLRALAAAVDRDGLPELGPKVTSTRRVCAKCGSGSYRYETEEIQVPASLLSEGTARENTA